MGGHRKRAGRTGRTDRVAELEDELKAAQKTIAALLDKAEEKASHTELKALTSNLDHVVRQRTRALAESEEQLKKKNVELQRMNAMKREFISIAAHELRTPLTSIVGYLDLMNEGRFGKLPAELSRPVASVRRNAHRLQRLVNEMLDVSRIERGSVSLELSSFDLATVVQDVVDEMRPLAETKKQALTADFVSHPVIRADADKIHQVVANLVANAVRYTPVEGTIKVRVDEPSEQEVAGSWARLLVRDNGIGIPQPLRDRIFEPFFDVNTAKHHTSQGPSSAGLGLYIARGIVDVHGGIISVASVEGKYSEFTVLLPGSEHKSAGDERNEQPVQRDPAAAR